MKFDETIFGNMDEYPVWSDEEDLKEGDHVTLVNANCEFTYDNINAAFTQEELLYCYICELEILDTDLSEYKVEKSNNGGCYAFAECRVKKVLSKTY